MKKHDLTIVSSCYNSERYLMGYFDNIIQMKGFENFILYIYLNSPTKFEIEIAEKYKNLYPSNINFEIVEKEFVSISTNRGFKVAETEFIVYADVDDRRFPDAYIRMMNTLKSNPECDLTYGDYVFVSEPDKYIGRKHSTLDFDFDLFSTSPQIGPGHFFRRSLLNKIGYWDEQLKSGADFDFQIRAALKSKFVKTKGDPITYYTFNDKGISLSSGNLSKIEALFIALRYGIYKYIPQYINYLPEITSYNFNHIKYNNTWIPLSDYLPNISEILDKRKANWVEKRDLFNKQNQYKKRFINKFLKEINPVWSNYK